MGSFDPNKSDYQVSSCVSIFVAFIMQKCNERMLCNIKGAQVIFVNLLVHGGH
jgi:hypothetical protein